MAKGLPYNGWPEFVRHGRDKHYYHARKHGLLPPATACLGCKEGLPEDCVSYHAEEYGPTLEDYWASCMPLCHRCHAMLHARFRTPNRWHIYLQQASEGNIDFSVYPQSQYIASLLSKFLGREDVDFHPIPENVHPYFQTLLKTEYAGASKVATLLVTNLATDEPVEVPDWTLYGVGLEMLDDTGRHDLLMRGIDVDGFLAGKIKLPLDKRGEPVYKRLYL